MNIKLMKINQKSIKIIKYQYQLIIIIKNQSNSGFNQQKKSKNAKKIIIKSMKINKKKVKKKKKNSPEGLAVRGRRGRPAPVRDGRVQYPGRRRPARGLRRGPRP